MTNGFKKQMHDLVVNALSLFHQIMQLCSGDEYFIIALTINYYILCGLLAVPFYTFEDGVSQDII